MARRRNTPPTQHGILQRPPHLSPADALTFIELEGFYEDLERLGLDDLDLQAIQVLIMADPNQPVVRGTGGLRKMRFAPAGWHTGKSGAIRVCYVHYPEWSVALLVLAYGKNEQGDISPAQAKAIKKALTRVEQQLRERFSLKK